MAQQSTLRLVMQDALHGQRPRDVARRSLIIGIISFLTLIDLFASQALLPQLVIAYDSDPAAMGFAVNAATFGMAISGLLVGYFADRLDRKRGVWLSLAALSATTFILAFTESVGVFTALRIVQGFFMAAAFTLTMTYIAERCDVMAAGGAMAAYITGNVASNLFGRLLAVSTADLFGVAGSFILFALLNLVGALAAYSLIGPRDDVPPERSGTPLDAWRAHLSRSEMRAAFGIGFAILFAFVGVFTYINLHLVSRLAVPTEVLGLVYFVFIPSLLTTPLAGDAMRRFGARRVFYGASAAALLGLGLTLTLSLTLVLLGLALIGVGTFFAQAAATGYVSRQARGARAAANGLYLTSYYFGGLAGAFVLGQAYEASGWPLVAGLVAAALLIAAILASWLRETEAERDAAS